MLNPVKLAYVKFARWPAPLTTSAFSQIGQYANSPGNRTYIYCYAELAVSSLAVAVAIAVTIASTRFAYPSGVDLDGLVKYEDGVSETGHPSQYFLAWHRVTSLMYSSSSLG